MVRRASGTAAGELFTSSRNEFHIAANLTGHAIDDPAAIFDDACKSPRNCTSYCDEQVMAPASRPGRAA